MSKIDPADFAEMYLPKLDVEWTERRLAALKELYAVPNEEWTMSPFYERPHEKKYKIDKDWVLPTFAYRGLDNINPGNVPKVPRFFDPSRVDSYILIEADHVTWGESFASFIVGKEEYTLVWDAGRAVYVHEETGGTLCTTAPEKYCLVIFPKDA